MILSALIHNSALTPVFRENAENPREGFHGNKPTDNVGPVCVWLSPFLQTFQHCQGALL